MMNELNPLKASGGYTVPQKKLGEWLLHLGLISKRQLEAAVEAQEANPSLRLGELLITKGYVTAAELQETLAVQAMLSGHTALKDFPLAAKTLSLLPESFSLEHEVLPLAQVGMRLLVAIPDARNFPTLEKITAQTGLMVVAIEVTRDELLRALDKLYNTSLLPPTPAPLHTPASPTVVARPGSEFVPDATVTEIVVSILQEANALKATDVHFGPAGDVIDVRCRVGGVLRKLAELPARLGPLLLDTLSDSASLQNSLGEVHYRVSRLIGVGGVHWQVRLAPPMAMPMLGALGMEEADLALYRQMLRGRGGLVMLAGHSGPGRAAMLRATTGVMDRVSNHVVLLEDIPGTQIPGVTQVLRGEMPVGMLIEQALECDADVLILGEVSSAAEMEQAMRASLGGLLVIVAVVVPNIRAALGQLHQWRIPTWYVSNCLRGVVAQHWARRNCPHCASEYSAAPNERAFLGEDVATPIMLVRGLGCDRCQNTGFLEQVGIFELMAVGQALQEAASRSDSTLSLIAGAPKGALMVDAKLKIRKGYTTVAEVNRLLGDPNLP